jgi:ABC-type transport system involved in multi-copper enzyme maturation permease subunit
MFIIALFCMLFEFLFSWLFFKSEASVFVERVLGFLPPVITKLMGVQAGTTHFTSQMLAFGYEHPIILISLSLLPISIPARYISGEVEQRTFNLLLTRPITRFSIPLTIFLFIMMAEFIIVLFMFTGTLISYYLFDLNINPPDFLHTAISAYFFYVSIGSISMLICVLQSERGKALARAIGLVVFLYFFDTIVRLSDALVFLLPFSYFSLFKAGEIVLGKTSALHSSLICLVITVILLAIATWQFNRRDI